MLSSTSKNILKQAHIWQSVRHYTVSSAQELRKLKDPSLLQTKGYIDGQWVDSAKGQTLDIIDPATLAPICQVSDMSSIDIKRAIDAAHQAFGAWSRTEPQERSRVLRKWYDLLMANREDLARVMTLENGKPLVESMGEVAYGAGFVEWFGEEARRAYGETIPMGGSRMTAIRQPVGVAGVITPYNFPLAMLTRKAGAALAAGCTVVARVAFETPLSALAACELGKRAGIPRGVLNVVTSSRENTPEVGLELTANPKVRKISFTGSTAVGKLLTRQAADTMKRVSMELGGNAPFIVFEDADLARAADALVACKFRNAGQTCVSANRVFVHERVHDEFVERLAEAMKTKLVVGHGLVEGVTMGPMITEHGLEKARRHVEESVAKGAQAVLGGNRMEGLGGYFFEPTVLVNMTDEMAPPMCCEETFGPVCPVFKFSTEEEVLQRANSAAAGLAGYFFSQDIGRAVRVAEALEVGMVGANTGVVSNPAAPFGGVKESGVGREGSRHGMDEYLNIKLINMGL